MLLCLLRSQPLALRLYSPCCTLCIEPSVTRSVHKPTGIDNTATPLEPTDGAEVGERRGTPIPTPVGYRSQNASLKPIQKTEPTDKKKNESDDILCTTLTLTPRYKFVIFSVFPLNSLSLSFTYGLCWAMALLESLSDMSLSHRLTSHWLTASLPPATPPVTPCLHSPSLTLPF